MLKKKKKISRDYWNNFPGHPMLPDLPCGKKTVLAEMMCESKTKTFIKIKHIHTHTHRFPEKQGED